MLKELSDYLLGNLIKCSIYGSIFFFGVPHVCDFLIKEIDQAMKREHRRSKLIAEQSYRYLMGETSIPSFEKYGR